MGQKGRLEVAGIPTGTARDEPRAPDGPLDAYIGSANEETPLTSKVGGVSVFLRRLLGRQIHHPSAPAQKLDSPTLSSRIYTLTRQYRINTCTQADHSSFTALNLRGCSARH